MARPGSSRPATARKSDRLNAGSPSSQWLPEPRATGAGTGVSRRREQLWSEQLCPGITTTGLRLTAPRDQKIVERAAPALCFYANFGDPRIIDAGGERDLSLPSRQITLISLNDDDPVGEQWRAGQRAATAGIILDSDLVTSLHEKDAEDFDHFLRK